MDGPLETDLQRHSLSLALDWIHFEFCDLSYSKSKMDGPLETDLQRHWLSLALDWIHFEFCDLRCSKGKMDGPLERDLQRQRHTHKGIQFYRHFTVSQLPSEPWGITAVGCGLQSNWPTKPR